MRRFCTASAIALLAAGAALADPPRFGAGYNVDQVDATNSGWLVSGLVADSNASGFDGLDVPAAGILVTESIYGDVDVFTYTLVTALVDRVQILATYAGTNAAPRVGTVNMGGAWLCEDAGGLGVPTPVIFSRSGPSPYLRDGTVAAAVATLAEAVAAATGTGDGGATNIVAGGANGYDAPTRTLTYVAGGGSGLTLDSFAVGSVTNGARLILSALNGLVLIGTNAFTGSFAVGNHETGGRIVATCINGVLQ